MSAPRVMSYNVRYFGHGTRGLLSTRPRIRRIAEGIAYADADFVCLQEVETQSLRSSFASVFTSGKRGEEARVGHQIDLLTNDLDVATGKPGAYVAYYFPAHEYRLTRTTNFYTTGLAVLAKREFSVVGHNADAPYDITHATALGRFKQARICAHVAFEDRAGERFDIFNTHLSLPSVFAKSFWTEPQRLGYGQNQLEEAKQLASFVDTEKRSENYVVVGDFNSAPDSPVDRYIRSKCGWKSAFADRAGAFATAGFLHLRMHIDHLYASPTLSWVDREGTHGFDERGRFSGLSDHVPLIARFQPA